MEKWKRRLLAPRWDCGDKSIFLLAPEVPRAGIIFYSTPELQVVAQWEGASDGVQIFSNRIAQIFPNAGVPPELVITRMINDIREAFEQCSKMKLHVSEAGTDIAVWSSDDWIRKVKE